MNILEKQVLFLKYFRILELYAESQGYVLVTGMHWRSYEESARLKAAGDGIDPSCHNYCLAAHVEGFLNGEYLGDIDCGYQHLGIFWERLDPLCRWGGRHGDGCHFSMAHGGMR